MTMTPEEVSREAQLYARAAAFAEFRALLDEVTPRPRGHIDGCHCRRCNDWRRAFDGDRRTLRARLDAMEKR